MSNIKNNNYKKIDCRLISDTYMDFMLSKYTQNINDSLNIKIATEINFRNIKQNVVVSELAWENSIPSNNILKNIGFTGVDNGFITYQRDRICNDEFLQLYTNSNFNLSTYNDKFFLTKVNGNANIFNYLTESVDDYVSLKGGFYQGFFKIDGDDYQTLPIKINKEWFLDFTLRKKNYETPHNTLNNKHINNKGIFFFIGTRSENKFWEVYKSKMNLDDYKIDYSDKYTTDDSISDNYTINNYKYFDTVKHQYSNEDSFFSDDYLHEQLDLEKINLIDSKERPIDETGFYEMETDNKFILFNQTKDGFTAKTWKDDYKLILTGKTLGNNINSFIYLNNTKNGYNKDNIHNLFEEIETPYNIFNDIENNALAFKINDDGSIGYRYLSNNCEIIEENSKPNLIEIDKWTNIKINIKRGNCLGKCKQGIMKIYIYVDNYLKFVSKELPEINLRSLNDTPEKQEGVPYSLSIGGGSQGLSERILKDYYDNTNYQLPIETYFGGTFIGDIKSFKFSYI